MPVTTKVALFFRNAWFELLAMLVPAGIRAIPEVMAGPYPIGWDTLAFYVPVTIDWAGGSATFLAMLGEAPLLYMISVPALRYFGTDPIILFKVVGPFLYGFMTFSLFTFLRDGLKWNKRKSLATSMFTALYFITLRVGWDLYRNMLGLSFLLLGLPLMVNPRRPIDRVILSVLIILSVLSNQFTAVLFLLVVATKAIFHLETRNRRAFSELLKIATPGLLTFVSIILAELASAGSPFPKQPPLVVAQSFGTSLLFMGYAYLPIAPLAILGRRNIQSLDMDVWLAICGVAAVLTSFPLFGLAETSYRWALLLTIPLCTYAAGGLSRIANIGASLSGPYRLVFRALPKVLFIALLVSAALYVALPAERAAPYFTLYPSMIPSSLLQNTIPLSDMDSLTRILVWMGANSNSQTGLITHQAFYGWAREYFHGPATIINYGYADPSVGIRLAEQDGYSIIVTIWWINGNGWHGQPDPPEGFAAIHVDGSLAALEYAGPPMT